MKKIKMLEKITAIFIVVLSFFTIYGFAYGGSTPIATVGDDILYPESARPKNEAECYGPSNPMLVYPPYIYSTVTPVNITSESMEILVSAPCGLSLSSTLLKIDSGFSLSPSNTVRVVYNIEGLVASYGFYLKFPTNSLQSGMYAIRMTNYYYDKSQTAGYNPLILLDITNSTITTQNPTGHNPPTTPTNTSSPPSVNTSSPTGSSQTITGSGTTSGTTPSTGTGSTAPQDTVTTDENGITSVNGRELTWSELISYIQDKITEADEAKLPDELREAPASLNVSVEKSEIVSFDAKTKKGKVKFYGRGVPNSKLTLYIFSNPMVINVETDANGDWVYELSEDLSEGEHEVYVAVIGDESKIKAKSSPYTFFISEALAAAGGAKIHNQTKNPNFALYYAVGSFAVLAIVVSMLFFFVTRKHIKKHVEATQNQP